MFEYAKNEYDISINRKNEIRNRSASFFTLGITIISAVATISFSISDGCFSTSKIVLLILSAVLMVISLVLFLLIYSPSNQLIHLPSNVIKDLRNIEEEPSNKDLIEYYKERDEFRYVVSEVSLAYVSERMSEMAAWYNDKSKKFMMLFILMSIMLIVSLILLIITIGI